jgi:quinol monooxygenase YgiN
MSLVLVVRLRVQEGKEEQALAAIRELAEASRREPGCEAYIPCRDPDDRRCFLFYEQYRDRTALDEHAASEHFQRLAVGTLFELLSEPRERTFYETVLDG